jgi:KaiC/GvpD/RAD55 family RecA-like ATPase
VKEIDKAKIEATLGQAVTEADFIIALEYAEHKMKFLNNLFGTNYGEDYLAVLTSEAWLQRQMEQGTLHIAEEVIMA